MYCVMALWKLNIMSLLIALILVSLTNIDVFYLLRIFGIFSLVIAWRFQNDFTGRIGFKRLARPAPLSKGQPSKIRQIWRWSCRNPGLQLKLKCVSGQCWDPFLQELWDQIYQIMLRKPRVLCSVSEENILSHFNKIEKKYYSITFHFTFISLIIKVI